MFLVNKWMEHIYISLNTHRLELNYSTFKINKTINDRPQLLLKMNS